MDIVFCIKNTPISEGAEVKMPVKQ